MPLSKADQSLIQKAVNVGASDLAVPLTDTARRYLAWLVVKDLGFGGEFEDFPGELPAFFSADSLEELPVTAGAFPGIIEAVAEFDADAPTYFYCLASLYKARLKYTQILRRQPVPSMDQVGPRGLLQFGTMHPNALTGFMLWRKWLFDIDNRAGQETGYLFEPIIASSIGGTPCGSRKSPVKRASDNKKGRQVDCLLDDKAYEFKVRVTIASSGQGRWREELEFPEDCRVSGFKPVLVVFDPTPNPKLTELTDAFLDNGGEVYVGEEAWAHLDEAAGATMTKFLESYVRVPLDALLAEVVLPLPRMTLTMHADAIDVVVGDHGLHIPRPDGLPDAGGEE